MAFRCVSWRSVYQKVSVGVRGLHGLSSELDGDLCKEGFRGVQEVTMHLMRFQSSFKGLLKLSSELHGSFRNFQMVSEAFQGVLMWFKAFQEVPKWFYETKMSFTRVSGGFRGNLRCFKAV